MSYLEYDFLDIVFRGVGYMANAKEVTIPYSFLLVRFRVNITTKQVNIFIL